MRKLKHIAAVLLASSLLSGCGSPAQCEHKDDNKDHLCDACGERMSECADQNKDHLCDVCGKKLSEHKDDNKDHLCDTCGEKLSEHKDDNNDHLCDFCGSKVSEHLDEDKDHLCDVCGNQISEHSDDNKDHFCDVCGEKVSEHTDQTGDHVCDVCGEPLPYVASVTISDAPESIAFGETVDLTVTVDAQNGATNTVTWSSDDACVFLTTDGNKVTVEGRGAGTATITATSDFDATVFDSVTIQVLDWTEDEIAMMEEYLGERIPFFGGDYVWTDSYYSQYQCLTAESENAEALTIAATDLEAAGWTVVPDGAGSYDFEYISTTNPGLVLSGNIYSYYGVNSVDVYATQYDLLEWPAEAIAKTLAFTDPNPEVVPAVAGDLFTFEELTKYDNACSVEIYGADLITYVNNLIDLGWSVDTSYYSSYGVLLVYSPRGSIELDVYPSSGAIQIYKLDEPLPLLNAWPTETVAQCAEGFTTETVPAATGDAFFIIEGTARSFYFAQVTVIGGSASTYLTSLEGLEFEVVWDSQYNCYTAIKGDLALDIYEFTNGNFSVCGYHHEIPKASWPAQDIATALASYTTTLPAAEGTGFTLDTSDDYYDLIVNVTGGDYAAYKSTLEGEGFSVSYDSDYQCDVAKKGDMILDLFENPNVAGEYAICVYTYATWPKAELDEALMNLGGVAIDIPSFKAMAFEVLDYSNYGAVLVYSLGSEITASDYVTALTQANWTIITSSTMACAAYDPTETYQVDLSWDSYNDSYMLTISNYVPLSTTWETETIKGFISAMEADGSVPPEPSFAVSGYTYYEPEGWYPAQINMNVEIGTEDAAVATYISQLEGAGYFIAYSYSSEYNYYALEGETIAFCPYVYDDGVVCLEFFTLDSPAAK